jgi:hypothetical protein
MNRISLFATSIALISTVAVAQSAGFTATLAKPLPTKMQIIAEGNVWRCEGTACVLVSAPTNAFSTRACHRLANKVGEITVYAGPGQSLETDKLAKCNAAS